MSKLQTGAETMPTPPVVNRPSIEYLNQSFKRCSMGNERSVMSVSLLYTILPSRNDWYEMSPFHYFEVESGSELIRTVMPNNSAQYRPSLFNACNVAPMHGKQ